MNRHLTRTSQHGSPVRNVPRPTTRKLHPRPSGDGGPNNVVDRITCNVCGWPGIPIEWQPGSNFPTSFTTNGTQYSWTSPSQPITEMDKEVVPVPAAGAACSFCGATAYLSGSRGSGNAV